jgi:hypothetical protein
VHRGDAALQGAAGSLVPLGMTFFPAIPGTAGKKFT